MLAGNVKPDKSINSQDRNLMKTELDKYAFGYYLQYDVNFDGAVTSKDRFLVKTLGDIVANLS
jgi:hypothetical protein